MDISVDRLPQISGELGFDCGIVLVTSCEASERGTIATALQIRESCIGARLVEEIPGKRGVLPSPSSLHPPLWSASSPI